MVFFKKNLIAIISMLIILVFFFFIMVWLEIEPFGSQSLVIGDCKAIYYPFLILFRRKILSGDGLFYYWTSALGDGFLPTYFFNLASPLNFFVVLFPENKIHCFVSFSIVIKIVASAGTFGFYRSHRNLEPRQDFYLIPVSCAYALSGFVLGYFSQCMWLDSYAILPIVFMGYNKMKNENNPTIYLIGLVCSAFCNFYITFVIGIFLVLYFFIDGHSTKKDFLRDGVRFISYSLLAIGMSSFPIIIALTAIFQTRIGDGYELSHYWFGSFFNILRSHLFLTKSITVSYNNNVANIYCGTFIILFLLIYLFSNKIDFLDKIKKIALLIFLIVSMNESILNYFWHGFHYQNGVPNRFSFIYIFVLLNILVDSIDLVEISSRRTISAMIIVEVFPIICYFFVPLDTYYEEKIILIIILGLLTIYAAIYYLYVFSHKKLYLYLISCVMLFELLFHAANSFKFSVKSNDYHKEVIDSFNDYLRENDYEIGDSIDRSIIIGTADSNIETYLGLRGVTSFNGFLNSKISSFLYRCGYFAGTVEIKDESGFRPLDDILGLRYVYESNDIYNLDDDYIFHIDSKCIYTNDHLSVFENDKACSLGFGINKSDEEIQLLDNECFENINKLTNNMTNVGDVLEEIYPVYDFCSEGFDKIVSADEEYVYLNCTPNKDVADPYIKLSFTAEKSGIYNLYLLMGEAGYADISVNGQARRHESNLTSGGIITLGTIESGDQIEIILGKTRYSVYGAVNRDDYTICLHMAVLNDDKYNEFSRIVNSNRMTIEKQSDSRFRARIKLDNNQRLFTSIPYDDGWHIYENGVEIKKDKYADTFICLDLGEGAHELEFRYIPKGLYLGIVISVISWIVFLYNIRFKVTKKTEIENSNSSEEK